MNYIPIYQSTLELKLSPIETLVYSLILNYQNETFYLTNKQIAEMFNVSEKTIIRVIKHLKELGLIKSEANPMGFFHRNITINNN